MDFKLRTYVGVIRSEHRFAYFYSGEKPEEFYIFKTYCFLLTSNYELMLESNRRRANENI